MNFKKLMVIFVTIFLNTILLFSEGQEKYSYEYEVTPDLSLEVYNHNGKINIKTWNKTSVRIEATKISWSWQAMPELEKVDVLVHEKTAQHTSIIETSYQIDVSKVIVNLEITIPESMKINTLHNYNGNIEIQNVDSHMKLIAYNGRIEVTNSTGDLDIKGNNSGIFLQSVKGNLTLDSSNGPIRLQQTEGTVTINSLNGRVAVKNHIGDMNLISTSGNIILENTSGLFTINSSAGKIKAFDHIGNLFLTTNAGKIDVEMVKGIVKAETTLGNIKITNTDIITTSITQSGNIEIEIHNLPESGTQIQTNNGSIEVLVSKNVNATVNLKSNNGNISIEDLPIHITEDLPLSKEGTLNGGGNLLSVKSVNGSITLKSF